MVLMILTSLQEARLQRELEREEYARALHEAAAKREELWTRLEAGGRVEREWGV